MSEWITLFILGIGKYQPKEDISFLGGWEAGMTPAQISGVSDAMNSMTASRTGLSVALRERTVSSLGKKQYLLKDIAMNIPNGSMVLLLGGSGAGKTTFMNAVIGYEKANADVFLNGVNVYKHYNLMKYRIGFVPQKNLIRTHDTVFRTINDAAKLRTPYQVKAEDKSFLQGVRMGAFTIPGDGCIDFDAAVRSVTNPKAFADGFDSGDHLHPSDRAYEAMAHAAVNKVIRHTPRYDHEETF